MPFHVSSSGFARCSVPEAELPVAGGVDVPVREGLNPALQPWALHDGGGEGRRGHVCGVRRACAGVRGAACRQWSGKGQISESLSSIFARRNWLRGLSLDPRAWHGQVRLAASSPLDSGCFSLPACSPCDVPTSSHQHPRALHCAEPTSAPPPIVPFLRASAHRLAPSLQRRMSMELPIR